MNILDFKRKKKSQEKISLLTCYDFWTAQIIRATQIEAVLVGDSLAMLMHGYPNTLYATVDMMAFHTKAVARGLKGSGQFLIVDLPFLSFRKSLYDSMKNVETLMQSGAEALKIEGVEGQERWIEHTVQSGVPVMGHIGLTPQSIHQLGGFHVQGKKDSPSSYKERKSILKQAKNLEDLGCFALVLECVPSSLAEEITSSLSIPTIGIGAGPKTDGQILVLQDLLEMNKDFKPKFLRQYLRGFSLIKEAIETYDRDVKTGAFPTKEESYNDYNE